MKFSVSSSIYAAMTLAAVMAIIAGVALAQGTPVDLLAQLDNYPHAERVAHSEAQVVDHEIGLGTIKKVRGVWQFKDSERVSGQLTRYTWQIVDGFTSAEVMEELAERVEGREGAESLFACQGRACGHGAQWANRVFGQRILYGREDFQQYQVFSLAGENNYRLVLFSAARTADRQYLHVELLQLESSD